MSESPRVAVLLPCLNEEAAIADVIRRARESLPSAVIYVYDNGSTDETMRRAVSAGAIVRQELRRGKGNVVRRMFADVEADVYVLLDGDGTYEVEAAPAMVSLLSQRQLDLVTGTRIEELSSQLAYRSGHRLGNRIFTFALRKIFNSQCEDVLSGFRVMSRRFVKSFPTSSRGFEIEVEMTAHASLLMVATEEFKTKYVERPANSQSKLNTYRDGVRIARALFQIFRSFSPSRFFGSLSLTALLCSILSFLSSFSDGSSGTSTAAIVALMFLILSLMLLSVGIILNALSRLRRENLRLAYLSMPQWPIS